MTYSNCNIEKVTSSNCNEAKYFLSVCILSYNRPKHLVDLLNSIDYVGVHKIEIVILDDNSPKITEIVNAVVDFIHFNKNYAISLYRHTLNLGYDLTLSDLIDLSHGEWIVFMGDDDLFFPKSIDKYINFVIEYPELAYVLKSHYTINKSGKYEYFRYFDSNVFFKPGTLAYKTLFRRSVFISGFMIKGFYAKKYNTKTHNESLLTQLYILAKTVLNNESAYFNEYFTYQYDHNIYEENEIMFDRVNKKYIERITTIDVSLNFLKSYLNIINIIDTECGIDCKNDILLSMSKYSYPSLSIQRHQGVVAFSKYVFKLYKMNFGKSVYFYIYYIMLLCLGENICNKIIYGLRNKLKSTPIL